MAKCGIFYPSSGKSMVPKARPVLYMFWHARGGWDAFKPPTSGADLICIPFLSYCRRFFSSTILMPYRKET